MSNGKGITWLDDCRIPFRDEKDIGNPDRGKGYPLLDENKGWNQNSLKNNITIGEKGRFPANLLVSDNAIDIGKIVKSSGGINTGKIGVNVYGGGYTNDVIGSNAGGLGDTGDFSRYFDLDMWDAQFIITPKASKSEKNKGLENFTPKPKCSYNPLWMGGAKCVMKTGSGNERNTQYLNNHPTVKPVKLFKYLVTLGSRENDVVLDPFIGSGTTALACNELHRKWIGIEMNPEYVQICKARLSEKQSKLDSILVGSK